MNNQSKDTSIKALYDECGYVVVEQAVDCDKIDDFLRTYEVIKKHPYFVYYAQSIHVGTRPKITRHGYIRESMQNASRLGFFSDFTRAMCNCLYHEGVSKALSEITGEQEHVSWQNMFFDQSTGTLEHQDSWYLDTDPAGGLIGVWYALEDIRADCGPFFVVPKSQQYGLISRDAFPVHNDMVAEVKRVMSLYESPKPMLLKKGDILLWHPFLIHGAFECENPALSRKSFTSHFYPKSCNPKDTESNKLLSIYNHQAPKRTANPHLYTAARFSDYTFNLMVYGMYFRDLLRRTKAKLSMRRDSYAK